MTVAVDLVVPIKELRRAKSRLVGATVDLVPAPQRSAAHAGLAPALGAGPRAPPRRGGGAPPPPPPPPAPPRPPPAAPDGGGPRRTVVVDDPGTGLNAA